MERFRKQFDACTKHKKLCGKAGIEKVNVEAKYLSKAD